MSENDDERVNRLKQEEIKKGKQYKGDDLPFKEPVVQGEKPWTSYSNVRMHADFR